MFTCSQSNVWWRAEPPVPCGRMSTLDQWTRQQQNMRYSTSTLISFWCKTQHQPNARPLDLSTLTGVSQAYLQALQLHLQRPMQPACARNGIRKEGGTSQSNAAGQGTGTSLEPAVSACSLGGLCEASMQLAPHLLRL